MKITNKITGATHTTAGHPQTDSEGHAFIRVNDIPPSVWSGSLDELITDCDGPVDVLENRWDGGAYIGTI